MNPSPFQQPTTSARGWAGRIEEAGRRCVLVGCRQAAAWIISDRQGGELPACDADLDVLLNDALARVPLDSTSGSKSGGPEVPGLHDTEPTAIAAVDVMVTGRRRPAPLAPADPLAVSAPRHRMSCSLEVSGVAGTIAVDAWRTHAYTQHREALVASVEELLEKARRLDLSSTEGRFRLGDLVEALGRELPAAVDLFDRLAIDLGVDRDTITKAWFVAAAFSPATRRPGLPWATYLVLRFHPKRHELIDRAASAGWDQARLQRELSARFAAHHRSPPDGSA